MTTPEKPRHDGEWEPWVIRKSGAFYRPNRCGYTTHPEAAGIYTREEAEAEASIEPGRISAHPLSEFRAEVQRNYDLARERLARMDAVSLPTTAALGTQEGEDDAFLQGRLRSYANDLVDPENSNPDDYCAELLRNAAGRLASQARTIEALRGAVKQALVLIAVLEHFRTRPLRPGEAAMRDEIARALKEHPNG